MDLAGNISRSNACYIIDNNDVKTFGMDNAAFLSKSSIIRLLNKLVGN